MMKKALLFSVIALALICTFSCDHLSSAGADVPERTQSSVTSSTVTVSDGSISFTLPPFPTVAPERDAVQTNAATAAPVAVATDPNSSTATSSTSTKHFKVTLTSTSNPAFTPDVRTGKPGDTIEFSTLDPGTYVLTLYAWDDASYIKFSGKSAEIEISAGADKTTTIPLCQNGNEHFWVKPVEEGVEITLMNLDPDSVSDITVSEDLSADPKLINQDFYFEFDNADLDTLFEDGTYTFLWPFKPHKTIEGTNTPIYNFKLQYKSGNNVYWETVVSFDFGSPYDIDLSKLKDWEIESYAPLYSDWNGLRYAKRTVQLTKPVNSSVNYTTVRNEIFSAIPEDELESFTGRFEIWAGDHTKWCDTQEQPNDFTLVKAYESDLTEVENLPSLMESFLATPSDNFFMLFLSGDEVNFLDSNFLSYEETEAGLTGKSINKAINDYGNEFTPTLKLKVKLSDVEHGSFVLPPVLPVCDLDDDRYAISLPYIPVTEAHESSDGIFEVVRTDETFILYVDVPDNCGYMSIQEMGTGKTFEFTNKTGTALTCSGQTVAIPWPFHESSYNYYQFALLWNDTSWSGGEERNLCIFGNGMNGHPYLRADNVEQTGPGCPTAEDIKISSDEFTIRLPEDKTIADYELHFSNSKELAESNIIYSLMVDKGTYDEQFDLRFELDGDNTPDETLALFNRETGFDVEHAQKVYWCNNDENGSSVPYYDVTSNGYTTSGFYNNNLTSGPQLYTVGSLAFRLKDANTHKYIDSGSTDSWWGEYRIQLWRGGYTYDGGAYPEQVGISMN